MNQRTDGASRHNTIHILAGQHFDIFWRKTVAHYRQSQKSVIDRVLDIIDDCPDFRFFFNQANVLRYYIEHNPDSLPRLQKHVASGAIEIVGGLEAIADVNMPSGESLIRNIIYGRQWVKEMFGVEPKIGAMLDVFGSSGQLPQILAKTGHIAFLSGRMPGAPFSKWTGAILFTWEGIDGSAINGIHAMYGDIPWDSVGAWYGWGVLEGYDEEYRTKTITSDFLMQNIEIGLDAMSQKQPNMSIAAFMKGEEHPPRKEVCEALRRFSARTGRPAHMSGITEFVAAAPWDKADIIKGEFNPEFTGCYTTRIRIKQWNQQAEALLYNCEYLEALRALKRLGEVDVDLLKENWRKVFSSQFHDALCGCHIDENYYHISTGFTEVLSDTQNKISRAIEHCGLKNDDQQIVTINTLPHEIQTIVRVQSNANKLSDSCGGQVLAQRDGKDLVFATKMAAGECRAFTPDKISNDNVIIGSRIAADGMQVGRYHLTDTPRGLCVKDTMTGRILLGKSSISAALTALHEKGTMWTEDYTGAAISEEVGQSRLESVETGPVFVKISYRGQFDQRAAWSEFKEIKWRKAYYIYRTIERIDVCIDVLFEGKATELKVDFECDIDAANATALYEIPFGSVVRKPYAADAYKFGRGNWPSVSWVDCSDDSFGTAIVHTGTPGCLAKDGCVSFSLLRSATYWSEPYFPAKPEELSFDNGHHHYSFAIIGHKTGDLSWLPSARAFVYKPVSELENVAVDEKQMCTGLSIDKPNVVLSTFKPAEDGNGAIIRVYETMGIETDFTVVLGGCDCKINRSSADELKTMDVVRGAIRIAPFEIVTLRLTPVR